MVFLAKLSILLQLEHIFIKGHRQPAYYIIQFLIWANLVFYVAYLFVDIFQCIPREKIWNPSISGKCVSLNALLIAPAGINLVSDLTTLILPMVLVSRLQMTLKNKLAIFAVFSSGLLSVSTFLASAHSLTP